MLNLLDEGRPQNLPRSVIYYSGDADQLAPPRETPLDRLAVRRWLIVLAILIIGSLCIFHNVPLLSGVLACLAFTAGAAFIPRVRALYLPLSFLTASKAEPNLLTVTKNLINGLPEAVVVLASDGTIVAFNGIASDLFEGLKLGWHISSAIRNPRVLDGVAAAGASEGLQTVAYAERVPVERHLAVTIAPLARVTGPRDPAILLFLRDLTQQERLDQMRADFIANASHELKTPLASLLGFIETLQGAARNDAEARNRFLVIMAKQAERMARLIDNLMSLSRVEMRAHLKPQDHVNLTDLVRSAVDSIEPVAVEAGVSIAVTSRLASAMVLGDRDELTQVFINLIHNAIKYGKPDGSVNITIEREPPTGNMPARVTVTVEDDGHGIAPQHLPRLTERFYRVPDSVSIERGGTGLGLAIVKHVVNRHRGELRIASDEGAGSRFTVLLSELS